MKRIKYLIFIIAISIIIPSRVFAITEDEARKLISDYAYFVYNNKSSNITYVNPSMVKFDKVLNGYYTENGKIGLDCNAFASFIIYNALQANSSSEVFDAGRVALNGADGWSSHSKYYSTSSYPLNLGETLQSASNRYDLTSKLKPGDLLAVVGYKDSYYSSKEESDRYTHIMVYVGNGKYIHNGGKGLMLTTLPTISHANKVGASFDGRTHGSITILKLKNYESIPSTVLNNFRFPNGNGSYNYYNSNGSSSGNGTANNTTSYKEEVKKIMYIVGIVLLIIRIIVPILLIVLSMMDLLKAMSENESGIKAVVKSTILKVISAIIIFLIPSFTNLITKLVNQDELFSEYMDCLTKPSSCKVDIWNKSNNNSEIGEIISSDEMTIYKKGTYIILNLNNNVLSYSISKKKNNFSEIEWVESKNRTIDYVLLPGTYYIYFKLPDKIAAEEIVILTSDIVDTKRVGDIKGLNIPLNKFLKNNNSSIEEVNAIIERSVNIVGKNSRESVAVAALSLTQLFYNKWKIKIPYGYDNWARKGVNPEWGKKTNNQNSVDKGHPYVGIHCGGFIAWSFLNANISINGDIGSSRQIYCWGYGVPEIESSDYYGDIGDVVTVLDSSVVKKSCSENGKGGHVGVIIYKNDNGFWISESDLTGIVTTFENANITRWRTILNMSNTYSKY